MSQPFRIVRLGVLLLFGSGLAASGSAQEYVAGAGLGFSYSDQDISAIAPAHVEGDTSPGSSWIRYDATAGRGTLHAWHQLYSCCVDNANAHASFRLQDVVFASPGGTGGSADVTFNYQLVGSANPDGGNLRVQAALASGVVNQGIWIAGPAQASSGAFTGYNDSSISGVFTSTVFTVPLDVPVEFYITTSCGTGSYQQVSTAETEVSFPSPGSGLTVFNIVSGPDSITVDSEQGDIVDNVWGGGALVAVGDEGRHPGLLLGPPTPNPSRGAVRLSLTLPEASPVSLRVYDVRGRLVETVRDDRLAPGHHHLEWNPSGDLPGGIYFARLRSLGEERLQRVVLIR
jgi:hypothetical protein